jgi:GNAT superfamily N-acetyltransferase
MSTYAEQYNYDYYQRLIENQGYEKEVDWVEFKVKLKEDDKTDYGSMVETLMKRNKFHFAEFKNTSDFVDKYVDDFFDLADETYSQLYGTVPFNAAPYAKKCLAGSVKTVVNKRYIGVILDENNRAAAFGLTFCSFADAVKKSNGHLTPLCLYRMFRDIKHPKRIEFGLVGVRPEYRSRGAGALAVYQIAHLMKVDNIEYADTNLNLEDNHAIINIWRHFDSTQNKRRRAFVKKL